MMPKFNPADYEPVEVRLQRAMEIYPDLRVMTDCVIAGVDGKWLFKASIYLTDADQAAELPKATGWASEVEGGPQTDFKAELGETSAIGRCLANMGFTGNKKAQTTRMTAEEAEKANKTATKQDWVLEASKMKTLEGLRKLYAEANAKGATQDELKQIRARADEFTTGGKQG
jgi:hypothetical protein